MLRSGYLRQQAETCLRLSQRCSNKATATELRLMAAEFFSKAVEVENDWLAASQPAVSEDSAQRRLNWLAEEWKSKETRNGLARFAGRFSGIAGRAGPIAYRFPNCFNWLKGSSPEPS